MPPTALWGDWRSKAWDAREWDLVIQGPPAQPSPALGKLKSTTPAWESSFLGSLSLKATWKMWYRDKEAGKLAAHAWDAAAA